MKTPFLRAILCVLILSTNAAAAAYLIGAIPAQLYRGRSGMSVQSWTARVSLIDPEKYDGSDMTRQPQSNQGIPTPRK